MATKKKHTGTKKQTGATRKAAAKPGPRKTSAPVAAKQKPAPARPASRPADTRRPRPAPVARPPAAAGPSLQERAVLLRDEVSRSKLTHPDPWRYTAKARSWSERAQAIVDAISRSGDSAAQARALESLAAEIAGDRDFQEARRLF